jgi:hypothetical protein
MTVFTIERQKEFDIKRLQGRLIEGQRPIDIADSQNNVIEIVLSFRSRVL